MVATTTITRYPRRMVTNRANYISNPRPFAAVGYGAYIAPATATLSNYADFIFARMGGASTVGGIYYNTPIPVAAGNTYTASAEVFTNKPIRISISWVNAAGAVIGTTNGAAINGDQMAVRSFVTGVAPAGAVSASLTFYLTGTGAGWVANDELRLRRLMFCFGTTTDYFDGFTPASGTTQYIWWAGSDQSFSSEIVPNPDDVTKPHLTLGYDDRSPSANTVHDIIGTSNPIVTLQPLGNRRGTLTLLFADAATAWAFRANLAAKTAFTFVDTDAPNIAMTFALDQGDVGMQLDPDTLTCWIVTVPFVETTV